MLFPILDPGVFWKRFTTYLTLLFEYLLFKFYLIQINQDAVEYAECEAVVKDFPPFREAMKRRGIEDMDLVMVDPW